MGRRKDSFKCRSCSKDFNAEYSSRGYYCSLKCQQEYQHSKYIERYLLGLEKGWIGKTRALSSALRRYILKLKGYKCEVCGWNEVHPVDSKPLVEIDHIDGNAENCSIENLKVLCPNHHSMTPTFRNRNKESKRNRK